MSDTEEQFVNEAIKSYIDKVVDDQPFYVANLSDVANKYRYWKSKLPRIEAFYAVTCNPDQILLRLMTALGMGFDCVSMGEINAVLSAGAPASNIIYSQPLKSNPSLLYSATVGVDLITFDCKEELLKIKTVFPRARLVLRIQIPGTTAVFPASDSFGCKVEQTQDLLQLGKDMDMDTVGVSFHVGSLCKQTSDFAKAIGMARQVFDTAEALGYSFTLLDIGGGYPGAKGTYSMFEKLCDSINESLEEHFPDGCGVRIIAEPGCFMVCSAYTLCTKILGKKVQIKENAGEGGNEKKFFYYMNDGVYGSFSHDFEKYGFQITPFLSKHEQEIRPMVSTTLWGVTCCSSDCILKDYILPEMEIGEYILLRNMGAYTLSMARTFNGFETACVHYIFPPHVLHNNNKTAPFEEFCSELSSSQLKALLKIQPIVNHADFKEGCFENDKEAI